MLLIFTVIALAACLAAVLFTWTVSPSYRRRVEAPKYRFLALQERLSSTQGNQHSTIRDSSP